MYGLRNSKHYLFRIQSTHGREIKDIRNILNNYEIKINMNFTIHLTCISILAVMVIIVNCHNGKLFMVHL